MSDRRRRRLAVFLTGFVLGALALSAVEAVLAYSDLADRVAVPLLRADTYGTADAIVVLGAAVDPFCQPNGSALRRTILAARLYRRGRAPLVLFTGGEIYPGKGCSVAQVMAALALELGVPAERLVLEERSENTWQNADYSSRVLRSRNVRRILLVTDSIHMRRAEACFRSFGYEIERASVPAIQLYGNNLELLSAAIHEYVGFWYYRWRGHLRGGET